METIEIETGANPASSIVVLHGLGADGSDFVPVCEMLELDGIGPVRFVFPHAPVRPVTANGGYRMRAWYDILQFGGTSEEDEVGLRESQAQVASLIDLETARGIAPSRVVLVGFSQGSAMALMTGLRHPQPLAGVAALSGYLPLAASTARERHAANHGVPIFLAHGTADAVVSIERGHATRDALQALGHDVEWHAYPIEHTVSREEITDLSRWLRRVLARPPGSQAALE